MLKRSKVLSLLLVIALVGCAKTVKVHPGAISNLDSYSYDVLLVEQDAISGAKAGFLANQLPPAAKDPLNVAIAQYNTTEAAWQAYHAGGGDATKLQSAVEALVAAVGELEKLIKPATIPVKMGVAK